MKRGYVCLAVMGLALAGSAETVRWQTAIDSAAANGGGVVTIPKGRHLVGQLDLKSNVELHLEKGAVLEGKVGLENYRVTTLPYSEGTWSAIVSAIGVTNVAITGEGEIFGNGTAWPQPEDYGGNQEGRRPRGVFFANCKDVRLSDFTLRDSACWGVVFKCCENVDVRRLKIDNHANANNDGIDIEAKNVVIADCDIDAGDDAVCLKSNTPDFIVENLVVTNVTARSHCNGLKLGTASHGTMRNILFVDCRTESPRRDFVDRRFGRSRRWYENEDRRMSKLGYDWRKGGAATSGLCVENVDGGTVENIIYRNIDIHGVCVPIFVRAGTRTRRSCGTPPSDKYIFRGIEFDNITGESSSFVASSVTGVEGCRIKDVVLKNIRLTCKGAGKESERARVIPVPEVADKYPDAHMFGHILPAYGLYIRHVDGFLMENVAVELENGTCDNREPIVFDDVLSVVAPLNDGWTADGMPVTLPHCWNAVDGADGPGAERDEHKNRRTSLELQEGYSRKAVSYRRTLPDPTDGKRQFLKVDAAATVATVKVNGREVGVHKGAFTAFCYEITEFLKPKDNDLEIVVDNRRDIDVAPISGDYTMMGGLYRKVWFIETPQVCIDRTIDGGPGVELDIRIDGHVTAKVHVLGGPDETRELYFPDPVLWTPENPKMYEARIELSSGDAVTIPFGFRTAEFREDGFYLNGVKRKLRGVCRHQEIGGKGWATTIEDERADLALIREMGADAVRTAHYPQSESFYSLLDQAGLVAWCEVPLLNGVTHSAAFWENLRTQYREMVAQLKHHPSICMWSIFNELYENFPMPEESAEPLVEKFAAWAKSVDPTRPQVAASDQVLRTRLNRIPADALAFNRYPGWYNGPIEGTRAIFDEMFASNATRKVFGISEYGGGGSIVQHGDPLVPCKENTIHTEEYQSYLHSRYYAEIVKEPRLWGTFLWVMFDFASDYRTEGDHPGINDKGMVCHDHKTKKDVFYFYQANWTKKPTLHLVGHRMKTFGGDKLNLLAFSNVGTVTLKVNGVLVGTKEPDDVATVLFNDVPLTKGRNKIVMTAGGLSDSCVIISGSGMKRVWKH